MTAKLELLANGEKVTVAFCAANGLPLPTITKASAQQWFVSACAYYRANVINICVDRCAAIGTAGRQWSYPGYTVDRTPYGVLQHELGHHADVLRSAKRGPYFGDYSVNVRGCSGEEPLTSYCPNDAEWFAEMFRLFVTNPDLLQQVRPRTHRELRACFEPVFSDCWRDRLRNAPARTLAAAERKVIAAAEELL